MKETLEDYDEYNEYCREEEIKRLKEAIAWTYSINERKAHICRYYLCKRLNEIEKPTESNLDIREISERSEK